MQYNDDRDVVMKAERQIQQHKEYLVKTSIIKVKKCHKILHCSRHSVSFISSPLLLLFYSAFSGTGALTEVTFASYMTGGVRK